MVVFFTYFMSTWYKSLLIGWPREDGLSGSRWSNAARTSSLPQFLSCLDKQMKQIGS